MLSPTQQIAFLLFAGVAIALAAYTWTRLLRRIRAGRVDSDRRLNDVPKRLWYAVSTSLTQSRTFRKRPWVSFFHSLIFYGFVFYLLVNLVDAAEGFLPFEITSASVPGSIYNLFADLLSAGVLLGVIALVLRRFLLPARRDFTFNERTLLHPDLKRGWVRLDSVIVSSFILFHVGSRALGSGAKRAIEGPDSFQPFATLLSHAFAPAHAAVWRIFGYWGALGSVLAFLAYFPLSKHIHIFMAPAKYFFARDVRSGVLPAVELGLESESESETPALGANRLEDLAWPRLLDAYACIQCNRCQDVCPATATGKSLSPSALEINKRMELNRLSRQEPGFEKGAPSPNPLLTFALSPEAAWACTTCGACIDVCPVGDEPMLDILDIRRQQVMIEGEFPAQLQSAFRGMERSSNPWGIGQEKRMDWAEGLRVPTTETKPNPDVLFWVGCAASYDPQSQKTARAFVQLLDHAGVDFAVLGKKECCTGDSARRAGNEYLYRQLADQNVSTLNTLNPKLIVATCPHCMNSIGKEYKQIGGEYRVMHHTEYLESLVREGRLTADTSETKVAFHDPCYLGRHNGVYDAPRNLLNILSNSVVELDRNRENSFCCGAGGAQFWKEEEAGDERISDNRYAEAQRVLSPTSTPDVPFRSEAGEPALASPPSVLAVGCPFCKSMLDSTPAKETNPLIVKDVAELLLEGVQRKHGAPAPQVPVLAPVAMEGQRSAPLEPAAQIAPVEAVITEAVPAAAAPAEPVKRKAWNPKVKPAAEPDVASVAEPTSADVVPAPEEPVKRKAWAPKRSSSPPEGE